MQVQIRRIGGEDVSLDDCANFSIPMGEALEKSQLIDEAYVLEVSSLGIGNELNTERDFVTFQGFPIKVFYLNEKGSEAHLEGRLHERSLEHLQLNIKGRIKQIPREKVNSVRLTTPAS